MKRFDCVVCGSCVADVVCRAVPLHAPIGVGTLLDVEPPLVQPGGIAVNVGIGLARLGLRSAALALVGRDGWGAVIRERLQAEGVDVTHLVAHPTASTRATVVLVDGEGERSLLCGPGASQYLDHSVLLSRLGLFAESRMCLLGYLGHMPALQDDLPDVLPAVRETGCRTALDAAPGLAGLSLLERILPHTDVYVPSYAEAREQTGVEAPREILRAYRRHGAEGIVGVKLGAGGVAISARNGHFAQVPAVPPPGPVIDSTGAGDAFYAGLIAGLLRGMDAVEAARIGAAAGARAVTVRGGSDTLQDWDALCRAREEAT